jgi:hypothetical protein
MSSKLPESPRAEGLGPSFTSWPRFANATFSYPSTIEVSTLLSASLAPSTFEEFFVGTRILANEFVPISHLTDWFLHSPQEVPKVSPAPSRSGLQLSYDVSIGTKSICLQKCTY